MQNNRVSSRIIQIIVVVFLAGSFASAAARKTKRKAQARAPRTVLIPTKKTETSRKNLKTKLRTFQKVAGKTEGTALRYLPKLREYVEPVNTSVKKGQKKKNAAQQVTHRRRIPVKTKTASVSRTRTQKRPLRRLRIRSQEQPEKIFCWPVDPKNFWLSSPFGPRTIQGRSGFHGGIDLAAATGTDVYAAAPGKVVEAKYSSGYGNFIMIAHADGYKTRYAHLSRSLVKAGQRVGAGHLIGKVGATGRVVKRSSSSSGSHLHFEVYRNGKWVDPIGYIA